MIKESETKVISRIDDSECDLVWIGITEDSVDEAYGAPCSVILRHYELKRQNYDEGSMLAKKKKTR